MRDGARVGPGLAHGGRLHGHGAVAGQPVGPVLVAHAQGLAQQQRAKACAVDEEIALDEAAVFHAQRGDIAIAASAGFRSVLEHLGDLALDTLGATGLAHGAQKSRVATGIKVVGVVQPVVLNMSEAVGESGDGLGVVVGVGPDQAFGAAFQPEVLETSAPVIVTRGAEGVEVVLPNVLPVLEIDAELEGGVRGRHELRLVDAEQVVEGVQCRDRRLAHADGADFLGLHQLDIELLAQQLAHEGGHHPAGSTSASDDHTMEGLHKGVHRLS